LRVKDLLFGNLKLNFSKKISSDTIELIIDFPINQDCLSIHIPLLWNLEIDQATAN